MAESRKILLSGANGVVGRPLIQRLRAQRLALLTVSRQSKANNVGALEWDMSLLLSDDQKHQIRGCTTMIHCAPIWLLTAHLPTLIELGVERLVVFSSTSVISKVGSRNASEQTLVTLLSTAEAQVSKLCTASQVAYTIFRPSMIYGYGRDQNVSKIARMIQKYRFMVLAGRAEGLRQPVHADDLIDAVLASLDNQNSFSQIYELAGGEVLSYRAMVERIFDGLGSKPRIVSIPLALMKAALWLAAKVTRFDYTPDMATRMSQDLIYDIEKAKRDIGFKPQRFLQKPKRDLLA